MRRSKIRAVGVAFSLALFLLLAGCGSSQKVTTGTGETALTGKLAAPASPRGKEKAAASSRLKQVAAASDQLSPSLSKLRSKAAMASIRKKTKKFQTADNLEPLANAVVSVFKIATGAAVATTVTDAAGAYTVTVPVGKGYLIVGTKIVPGTTDVKIVKLAVDDVAPSAQPVTLPQGNPTTTVAAEIYAKAVRKKIEEAKAAGTLAADATPEDLDEFVKSLIEKAEADFEKVLENTIKGGQAYIDQLYNRLDAAFDQLRGQLADLGDFTLAYGVFGDNEGEAFAAYEDIALLYEAADEAFDNSLDQHLGEDYETLLQQYEEAVAQAWEDYYKAIAIFESTATAPKDDYYVYLAKELQEVATEHQVTIQATAQSLAASAAQAEANFFAILNDPNRTPAQECAAYERWGAEDTLVNYGYTVQPRGSGNTIDQLESALVASQAGSESCAFTFDLPELDALWAFVGDYVMRYAYKLKKGAEPTDAQLEMGNELFGELGFVDRNDNRLQDPDEPGFTAQDYADAEAAGKAAAGSEPVPPADGATQEQWDAYSEAWEVWYDKYWDAYDDKFFSIGIQILIGEDPNFFASVDEGLAVIDLADDLGDASDDAWEAWENAWEDYWANAGPAYDAAWAALQEKLNQALNLLADQGTLQTAFKKAEEACLQALAEYNVLEGICDIYAGPFGDGGLAS